MLHCHTFKTTHPINLKVLSFFNVLHSITFHWILSMRAYSVKVAFTSVRVKKNMLDSIHSRISNFSTQPYIFFCAIKIEFASSPSCGNGCAGIIRRWKTAHIEPAVEFMQNWQHTESAILPFRLCQVSSLASNRTGNQFGSLTKKCHLHWDSRHFQNCLRLSVEEFLCQKDNILCLQPEREGRHTRFSSFLHQMREFVALSGTCLLFHWWDRKSVV